MKNAAITPLLLSALIAPALAVITFPITRREDFHPDIIYARNLFARTPIIEALLNNRTLYQAEVTVGTPPQPFSLDIDTGSSDVYILDKNADQCTSASVQDSAGGGCFGGTFDSTASSTFKDFAKGAFGVNYSDNTGASGDFITDNFGVGGVTIKGLIMGLAFQTTTGNGLIGLGYDTNEAQAQSGASNSSYPNIIDTMLNQSIIQTKTYSLWLNDYASTSGSIMFGGADVGKFTGQLKSLPFIPDPTQQIYLEFIVGLTGLSITNQSGVNTAITTSSFQLPVLLDSGTTLCYLPTTVVDAFAHVFNAVSTSGVLVVDCAFRTAQTNGYITFSFGSGGPVINVPFAEMVIPIQDTDKCRLGMKAQSSGTYILGDAFLRSAYAVFDLNNNMGALAQANFNSTFSSVVEFKASDKGIPTLTGQTSGTETGTGTGTGTGTTQAPSTSSKSAASTVPPFQSSAVVIFALSAMLSLLGGLMFLA